MRQKKQHPNKTARRQNRLARDIHFVYGVPLASIGLWPGRGYASHFRISYSLQDGTYTKRMKPASPHNEMLISRDVLIPL